MEAGFLTGLESDMGKYTPLTDHLKGVDLDRVQMTFKEVEEVLGFSLPKSARTHRPWWANTAGSHVQSAAWIDAGYETENVSLDARRLVFRRVSRKSQNAASRAGGARSIDSVYGCLDGTVLIHGDITRPVEETWSAEDGRV
jgi:hypothetical protein